MVARWSSSTSPRMRMATSWVSGRVAESMHHTFADIWRELVTPEEFEATNFPNQVRTGPTVVTELWAGLG